MKNSPRTRTALVVFLTLLPAGGAGPEGSVLGHNTPYVIEKYVSESWPARLAKPVKANVVRVDGGFENALPEGRPTDTSVHRHERPE